MAAPKVALAVAGVTLAGFAGGILVLKGRGAGKDGDAAEAPQLAVLRGREPKLALGMLVRILRAEGGADTGVDLDHEALVRGADVLSQAMQALEQTSAEAERGEGASPSRTRLAIAQAIAVDRALGDVHETLRECRDRPLWAVEFADYKEAVSEWADTVAHNVMQDTNSSMAWR